jgi:ABC-type nitrate/sulfonate/bicarbonate transport system substrate-binding protein
MKQRLRISSMSRPGTRGRAAVLAVTAVSALVLAACGSGGGSASSGSGSGSGSSSGSGVVSLKFAYAGAVSSFAPEMLMQDNPGMCAQYGVNPSITNLNPAAAAPALAAGQVQVVVQGSGSFLLSALKDPSATKIVAGTGPLPLNLYVTKDVHSVADLNGKTVGASSQGALSDLALREAISEGGLTVGKQVKITFAGTSAAEIGLAASGAISAFAQLPPLPAAAQAAGVHVLRSLVGDPTIDPLADNPVGVNTSFLQAHPAAVKGLLRCLAAANKKALADPTAAATALAKYQSISQATAATEVAAAKGSFTLFSYTVDAAKTAIKTLEKYNIKQFGGFDPSTVIDNSMVPQS